jgi:carboxypeptidase PM20D1
MSESSTPKEPGQAGSSGSNGHSRRNGHGRQLADGTRSPSRIAKRLGIALGVLGVLLLVLGIKTAATRSRQLPAEAPLEPLPDAAAQHRLAERLGRALTFETVSRESGAAPETALRGLHAYLRAAFPAVHATLKLETIADFSLLYTWPGSDPSARPYLLLAHQDVVPVEAGTEGKWTYPPFSGSVEGGFIWGRGALDDKVSVLGILEAVERLVQAGFRPRRTVYLAFGHDEEVSGQLGAMRIAATLQQRGVRLDYVLDEGMLVTRGIMPGLARPVATVGLAEKGFLSVELLVDSTGGHSSMPPPHTAVGVLAAAITRLEDEPLPAALRPPTSQLFDYVVPEMPLPLRVALSNAWLLRPILMRQFAAQRSTNALIRTTTAVTMIEGSPKANVLPQRARAVVNFRVLPGDTTDGVLLHVRRVVGDARVKVTALPQDRAEPSPISSPETAAFRGLARAIRAVFPEAVVAPALMIGQADARHFAAIADSVYRFAPLVLTAEDLDRLHGTDERIGIANYVAAVRFYGQIIRNSDAAN